MNPSFTAMQKAWMTTMSNMMFGIEHKPKKAEDKETSINGRAFAPGKGVQQLESSEEKEANVRAHLDKLASEAKARYLDECSKYPTLKADVEKGKHDFPRSDMVVLMEEEQELKREREAEIHIAITDRIVAAEELLPHEQYALRDDIREEEQERRDRITFNTKADSEVMTALYGSDNGAKIDETSTHEQALKALHDTHTAYIKKRRCPTIAEVAAERHKNHQDYIDRQIALNHRTELLDLKEEAEPYEPKYPTSDMIEMLHDHIAELKAAELLAKTTAAFRASNACVYTGEHMNLEEAGANNGTKFEAK